MYDIVKYMLYLFVLKWSIEMDFLEKHSFVLED
jgi:hypothetical protein